MANKKGWDPTLRSCAARVRLRLAFHPLKLHYVWASSSTMRQALPQILSNQPWIELHSDPPKTLVCGAMIAPSNLAWWEWWLGAFETGAVACLFGLFSQRRNWFARVCLALTYLFAAVSVLCALLGIIRLVRSLLAR